MQCLAWQDCEAVPYKLLVFGKCCAPEYLIPPIFLIIEKRVFYMAEMNPYLVCAAGFEPAFNNSTISEIFNQSVVSDSCLP